MAVSNPYTQYQDNHIITAGPEELLLIAYDHAIKFARIGREKMRAGAVVEKSKNIGKSRALIVELMSMLVVQQNAVLAANLANLYEYMVKRLAEAELNNDEKPISEVIDILTNLRSAWGQRVLLDRAQFTEGRLAA